MKIKNTYVIEAVEARVALQGGLNKFEDYLWNIKDNLDSIGISLKSFKKAMKNVLITEVDNSVEGEWRVCYEVKFGKYDLTPRQAELVTILLSSVGVTCVVFE